MPKIPNRNKPAPGMWQKRKERKLNQEKKENTESAKSLANVPGIHFHIGNSVEFVASLHLLEDIGEEITETMRVQNVTAMEAIKLVVSSKVLKARVIVKH